MTNRMRASVAGCLLTFAAAVGVAHAQTAPTSQPTTRPALTLYVSIAGRNHRCYTGATIDDLPALQSVHSNFIDPMAGFAKAAHVGAVLDFEDEKLTPGAGIGTTHDLAQLTKLDNFCRELTRMLREVRTGAGIDRDDPAHRRPLGAYVGLPIGSGYQYDTDQAQFVVDNKRVAAADPLREADFLCMDGYIWIDDVQGMTPAAVRRFTGRKLAAARLLGKPIMLFILPIYVNSKPARDLPDELLQELLAVARDERLDACLWNDGLDAPEAKRQVDRVLAAARAVNFR